MDFTERLKKFELERRENEAMAVGENAAALFRLLRQHGIHYVSVTVTDGIADRVHYWRKPLPEEAPDGFVPREKGCGGIPAIPVKFRDRSFAWKNIRFCFEKEEFIETMATEKVSECLRRVGIFLTKTHTESVNEPRPGDYLSAEGTLFLNLDEMRMRIALCETYCRYVTDSVPLPGQPKLLSHLALTGTRKNLIDNQM